MAKKTWVEKRDCDNSYKIKTIDKKFAEEEIPIHKHFGLKVEIVEKDFIKNY